MVIRKRRAGPGKIPEENDRSKKASQATVHQHEHAPVLDPVHPVHLHHHDPADAYHQTRIHDHHFRPHQYIQHHHEAGGFDQRTRNMK
jgi:hypothetical protein